MNRAWGIKAIGALGLALLLSCAGSGAGYCEAPNQSQAGTLIPSGKSPDITSGTPFDSVLDSLLGDAEPVADLQGEDLADALSFSSDKGKVEIERTSEYARCALHKPANGFIRLSNIEEMMSQKETENYAIVYRIKPAAISMDFQFMLELAGARMEINTYDKTYHSFIARVGQHTIEPADQRDLVFGFDADQWYNVLITLDHAYTYQYLMWQDSDPSMHIYIRCDLSPYFEGTDNPFANPAMAEITFSSQEQESWVDLESVKVYRYQGAPERDDDQDLAGEETAAGLDSDSGTAQQVQPVEDKSYKLPLETKAENGFQAVCTGNLLIDGGTGSRDIVNAILESPLEAAVLTSKALTDRMQLNAGSSLWKGSITDDGAYIRVLFQRENGGQTGAPALEGNILFNGLGQYLDNLRGSENHPNSAVLLKYRFAGIDTRFGMFLENNYTLLSTDINFSGVLTPQTADLIDEYGSYHLGGEDGPKAINLMENEWYYTLIAMDGLGYRFITWQEKDPLNHAFYACELSGAYTWDHAKQERYIWSGVNLWTQADTVTFDLESLTMYAFEGFQNGDTETGSEPQYDFADDGEQYRLAERLFQEEDYHNAYLLFKDLDGYDASDTYLQECGRLLQTVEITSERAANRVADALNGYGMEIEDCLYVYQAEKIESLDLSECRLKSIGFLRYFANLKELNLNYNYISDVTPLKELSALESLSIAKNSIDDLSPLESLPNLQRLDTDGDTESEDKVQSPTQGVITFSAQTTRPIENNPFRIRADAAEYSRLRQFSVDKPSIEPAAGSGDVVSAIISSPREVVTLQNDELLHCIELQTTDSSLGKALTQEDGYIRAHIQTSGSGQNEAQDIWGKLYFDEIRSYISAAGGIREGSNGAVLLKYRYTGINSGISLFLENRYLTIYAGISCDGSLSIFASKDGAKFIVGDLVSEGVDPILMVENEWYYTLFALDGYYGCGFVTWQENDPANSTFYTCDFGATYRTIQPMGNDYFWAGVDYWTHAKEADFDIASLSFYEFDDFAGGALSARKAEQRYEYSNQDEQYRLALQFFDQEDYYNAYLLLKELNGYDTSGSYLQECERLLQTVVIESGMIATSIINSMQDAGMEFDQYIYRYQAEKFESLDVSECEIEDLEFIRYFPNLKQLNLDANGITDLTPLMDLHALVSLSLAENSIADVKPLHTLTRLTDLDLRSNMLEDVSPLGNLHALKRLDLSRNNIHSLAGLYTLTNLETVNASYNFISSVNALGNSRLRELNIINTNIDNLWAVAGLETLERLQAGVYHKRADDADIYLLESKYRDGRACAGNISGLEAVASLTNLKTLYLAGLRTQTMKPLSQLPSLESLTLYAYSGPTDYAVLSGLTGLKEISLDGAGGGFDSLHFLTSLTNLETLEIGGGSTSGGAWPIASLVNLQKLALSGFDTDLSFLSGLDNLRELRLEQWDGVKDFSPLLELDSLEYLELKNTPILDFSMISKIETLRCIKMSGERFNSIVGVDKLKNLEYLDLGFAQYSKKSNYEQLDKSLLMGLENLQYAQVYIGGIDGKFVGYTVGDIANAQTLELPSEGPTESWEYFQAGVGDQAGADWLIYAHPWQYLSIRMSPPETGEPIKLKIPPSIRVLGIMSDSKKPIAIELDCKDNIGLETIFIGHIDCYWGDDDGAGGGNFVIDTLDGLAGCINLREVYINSAEIKDISGLAGCEKLEIVELKDNKITDISALADKQYLSEVKLSKNKIKNYDPLYSCFRLQSLDVKLSTDTVKKIKQLPLYGK